MSDRALSFSLALSLPTALCGALFGAALYAQDTMPEVPSGLPLTLQEIVLESQADSALWARFRYVAPALRDYGHDKVADDFATLCASQVLPWLKADDRKVAEVVISIATAPVEFGSLDPAVTQFFEVFQVVDDSCIWGSF